MVWPVTNRGKERQQVQSRPLLIYKGGTCMYTLIIVDDDELIRKGLEKVIRENHIRRITL